MKGYKEYNVGKYIVREWEDGEKEWWFNGLRHREDGPAWIWEDGTKRWRLEGIDYTEQEWNFEMRKRKLRVLEI